MFNVNAERNATILLVKIGDRLGWFSLCMLAAISLASLVASVGSGHISEITPFASGFLVATVGMMFLKEFVDGLYVDFRHCYEIPVPENAAERRLANPLVVKKLCRVAIKTAATKREYEEFLIRPLDHNASPDSVKAAFTEHKRLLMTRDAANEDFRKALRLADIFQVHVPSGQVDDLVGIAKIYGIKEGA